jgi:translation initiation factor IF-1
MKKEKIEVEGKVLTEYRGDVYEVELGNGAKVRAKRAGRLIQNKIRIVLGDEILVELCPYDLAKGRIVYRIS